MTRLQAMAYRKVIEKAAKSLDDNYAIEVPQIFPSWEDAWKYTAGDRVCYEGLLYKCLQDHTSQMDWRPDAAVSLWVRVDDPGIEWPEWRQPTGAQDAYAKDAKVSHNEKHWISLIDANVWEPGAIGTEALWQESA